MKAFFVCFFIVLSVHVSVNSNGINESGIHGNVIDGFGASVPEVTIHAIRADGKRYESRSRSDGTYGLYLPKGIYTIRFEQRPFNNFVIDKYQIAEATNMRLDVSMICTHPCEPFNDL